MLTSPNDDMPIRAPTRYRGDHFVYVGELLTEGDHYLFLGRPGKSVRKRVTINSEFFAACEPSGISDIELVCRIGGSAWTTSIVQTKAY